MHKTENIAIKIINLYVTKYFEIFECNYVIVNMVRETNI